MSVPLSYVAAFRYTTEFGGRKVSLASVRWEGRDIVVTRPLIRGGLPLLAEVQEGGSPLRAKLYDRPNDGSPRPGTPEAEYDIAFDRVEDMGFLCFVADRNEAAFEAVRLVDARVVESRRALPLAALKAVREARADGEGTPPA